MQIGIIKNEKDVISRSVLIVYFLIMVCSFYVSTIIIVLLYSINTTANPVEFKNVFL